MSQETNTLNQDQIKGHLLEISGDIIYRIIWREENVFEVLKLPFKKEFQQAGICFSKKSPYFQTSYLFLALIRTIPIWVAFRTNQQSEKTAPCPQCCSRWPTSFLSWWSQSSPPTALQISVPAQLLSLPPNFIHSGASQPLWWRSFPQGSSELWAPFNVPPSPILPCCGTFHTPMALNGVLSPVIS